MLLERKIDQAPSIRALAHAEGICLFLVRLPMGEAKRPLREMYENIHLLHSLTQGALRRQYSDQSWRKQGGTKMEDKVMKNATAEEKEKRAHKKEEKWQN